MYLQCKPWSSIGTPTTCSTSQDTASTQKKPKRHDSEERVLCFGRTKSGRLLTILYTERRGKIRVVTAYEMTKAQQQMYFEGK